MSRPLNFREIETFRAVMLTGTTTAAAAMLHVSQPSVSRILAQMQLAAGIKLFDTKANKLQPTPEAAILFKSVQSQFRGMRYIEQDIDALRKAGVGILRLGCTPALGLGVMSAIIARFIARHQEIRIHLETVNSHQLGEGLLHGWLDLAMVSGRLSVTQFDSQVVHRTRAVCIMQPSHPLAANTCLHVRQLAGQNLLMLKADDELSIAVDRLLHEHGVQTTTSVETNYSATLCSAWCRHRHRQRLRHGRIRFHAHRPAAGTRVSGRDQNCVANPQRRFRFAGCLHGRDHGTFPRGSRGLRFLILCVPHRPMGG